MNKTELIAAVAEKAGLTKKDVEKTITATLETVKEVVAKGDKVQVVGFGTFEARARKEREGKNPQNGEKVVIPAATIPSISAISLCSNKNRLITISCGENSKMHLESKPSLPALPASC